MRTKFLRRAAVAVSLSAFALSGNASADNQYSSPSRWNNFRPALDEALAAEDAADDLLGGMDSLPAPSLSAPQRQPSMQQGSMSRQAVPSPSMDQGSYQSSPNQMQHDSAMGSAVPSQPHYSGGYPPANYDAAPQHMGTQYPGNYSTMPAPAAPIVGSGYGASSDCQSCQNGVDHTHSSPSPYAQAMSSPWDGGESCSDGSCGTAAGFGGGLGAGLSRPALFPWFGGANLLFFNLQEDGGRRVATGLTNDFFTDQLNPGTNVGYDVSLGRYFGCGQYGLGVTFFQWNPGIVSHTVLGTGPGSIRASQPQYRDALLNFDPTGTGNGGAPFGAQSVYDHIDGMSGASDGAYQVRMTRDLNFYGLELNLFSFGLMGAQRAAYAGCAPGHGAGAGLGLGHGRGFGGAAGPLVRSNSGRTRITTSHGIRYMRITDETNIAYGIDLNANATDPAGPARVTIFDDLDTENEMLGYQFGGTLTYCLGSRLDLNIGGKFGIFGNRATMRHRLGTDTQVAYLTPGGTDNIDTESSDTVLSTLGELDLGLGCRVTRGWTVRGGYRVMGITGVANAVDSRGFAYTNIPEISQVHADDSYLLHGAYVGAQFNW